MDKAYEKKYHEIEYRNWWFLSRRNCIVSMVSKYKRNINILDIGCSSGALMLDLKRCGFTNVYGLDFSMEAIEKCKENGLNNVFQMDAHYPEFENEKFDLIISSDSLEHLEKDELALSNWFKILKTGGELIIFVPAFQKLWSVHDVVNHHYRRYTKDDLKQKTEKVGFTTIQNGYWNFLIYFPTYLVRAVFASSNKSKQKDQLSDFNPVLNAILIVWMKFENFLFRFIPFPVGVSAFIINRKNES